MSEYKDYHDAVSLFVKAEPNVYRRKLCAAVLSEEPEALNIYGDEDAVIKAMPTPAISCSTSTANSTAARKRPRPSSMRLSNSMPRAAMNLSMPTTSTPTKFAAFI
jgi:hypothetical protein